MTTPTSDNDQLRAAVEQCDRDAASRFYERYLARPNEVPVAASMRAGKIDESPLIQAFARHRIVAPASDWNAAIDTAARVAANWKSSLRPGHTERRLGHEEAARDIADDLRSLRNDQISSRGIVP